MEFHQTICHLSVFDVQSLLTRDVMFLVPVSTNGKLADEPKLLPSKTRFSREREGRENPGIGGWDEPRENAKEKCQD